MSSWGDGSVIQTQRPEYDPQNSHLKKNHNNDSQGCSIAYTQIHTRFKVTDGVKYACNHSIWDAGAGGLKSHLCLTQTQRSKQTQPLLFKFCLLAVYYLVSYVVTCSDNNCTLATGSDIYWLTSVIPKQVKL